MLREDIKPGYAPKEISFMGYKTKNLHHSEDAVKAFQDTIAKAHAGSIRDHQLVKDALMHTDQYMKLNDMHLEQGKAPTEQEVKQWVHMHEQARRDLEELGEFPHHMDYWHNHLHELQLMRVKYTPEVAGAEMADSYTPEGNMVQEELSKTIKPADRVKVARVIADMLGVENAESMSPDTAVNQGLRKIKNKRMTPEFVATVKKMVQLAQEVGIKVDQSVIPTAVSEEVVSEVVHQILSEGRLKDFLPPFRANGLWIDDRRGNSVAQVVGHGSLAKEVADALNQHVSKKGMSEEVVSEDTVNKKSTYNAAKDIMRFNDFAKLSKINQGEVPVNKFSKSGAYEETNPSDDDKTAPEEDEKDTVQNIPTQVGATMTHPADDQLRRRKVAYKLGEEVDVNKMGSKQRAAIKNLRPGSKTSFDDESGRQIHAHREGDKVHLVHHSATGSSLKTVDYKHFDEEIELEEDAHSADYKVNPDTGRKYRARHIEFAASKMGGAPARPEEGDSEDKKRIKTEPIIKPVKESSMGTLMAADKIRKDKEDSNKRSKEGSASNAAKQAADLKKSQERDAAWWKAQDDAHKAGKTDFEFDGKKYLLKSVKENYEENEHDGISTESDLDDMVKQIEDEEDILDAYDEDELVIVDQDTGEVVSEMKEEVEQLDEVLSRMERMRAKIRFARTASKRNRRLQIALRSRSSATKINARARRLAVKLMKQRLTKKPLAQMTVSDKERAEKIIQRRKALINRLAMKLAPRIRKIENARLSHSKVTK